MAAALPQDLAQAMMYGPQTQQAIRRSAYLSDALKQTTDMSQPIRGGWGELGAKLLATAILSKATDRAQQGTLTALKADQDAETQKLLAGLGLPTASAAAPQIDPGMSVPSGPPSPQIDPGMSVPRPPPQGAPANYSPQDTDALSRMIAVEAGGEGPAGMAAAGHVALNRLKSGYGGAKSLSDVVNQPHQFEGIARGVQPDPHTFASAQQVAQQILSGQVPDPTGGAMAFLNPDLQVKLGRQIPSWAQGNGQRIGNHVFFGGKPADVQMTAGPAPQGPLQISPTFAGAQQTGAPPQSEPQPYQVAANGQTPPPPQPPSAPGSSPPVAGAPPAPQPPQVPGAGGNAASQWPLWKPSQEEYHYVQGLLMDPRTHAAGVQAAMQMREKMTQPVEATVQMINGAPFYVPKDPTAGLGSVAIPVPKEAMSQTLSAAQAGVAAPPGTSFNRDPLGNIKQVYQPQNGQMITSAPGGPYREAPIPGGTTDPRAPQQQFANEEKLRNNYEAEIKPYIAAREGYQKVIQAANTSTPAGDIAMVFGYMKTLDPNSTVREGEQAQVNNSGTIPQTVTNMYNKLITGDGRLTPEQRAQFADSARRQFEVYQSTADALNTRYGGLAQSYGFQPDRVVRSFSPIEPYHPVGEINGVPAAARSAYVGLYKKGQIDTSKPDGDPLHPMIAVSPEVLRRLDTPANRGKHVITPDGKLAVIE